MTYATSRSDMVIVPAQEQQQDITGAIEVIDELARAMRAFNITLCYCLLLTRTRVVAKSRTARHIAGQLARSSIPCLRAEVNERDAFSALFSVGGTLRQLTAADVNNLPAALSNAEKITLELEDRLNEHKERQDAQTDHSRAGG